MDKTSLLQQIQKAKSAHIKWCSFAQALAAGVSIDEATAPVQHTHCEFGEWYHGPGKAQLGHLPGYQDIAKPHEVLHATYEEIYALVNKGKVNEVVPMVEDLNGISRSFLDLLGRLEKQVKLMNQG